MHYFARKTFLTAAATATLALLTTACQDQKLTPTPTTQFSDQVVFSTPARIALQVNGLYSYIKTGNFYGGRYQIYGDIQLNDFLNRQSNAVTGLTVWNHTETETSSNDVINCWSFGYGAINQINVFLAGLDANQANFVAPTFPTTFSTTANQYRGEARLLRALAYYALLQLYARPYADGQGSKPGLPLRLLAEKSPADNALARSTVAEIYAQILADLNFAEQNLPLTYSDALTNTTRAHRNTAIALKTRVYLSMANYASVITEANKIVPTAAPYAASSGVANALNSSITAVFAPPQTTTESILSFPFTAQDTPGTQNQLAYYYLPSSLGGNGEYSLNQASGSIYADAGFGASDVRRTSLTVKVGNDVFLRKYPTGTPFSDFAPAIRYSEVLLSLAEARVRTNGASDAQALALLNAVRTRSNGTAYTGFTSATDFINAILLERRIEFLGEGIRYFDIMRTLSTIPGKGVAQAVAPTDQLYIWPIPITEVTNNPLMTRN